MTEIETITLEIDAAKRAVKNRLVLTTGSSYKIRLPDRYQLQHVKIALTHPGDRPAPGETCVYAVCETTDAADQSGVLMSLTNKECQHLAHTSQIGTVQSAVIAVLSEDMAATIAVGTVSIVVSPFFGGEVSEDADGHWLLAPKGEKGEKGEKGDPGPQGPYSRLVVNPEALDIDPLVTADTPAKVKETVNTLIANLRHETSYSDISAILMSDDVVDAPQEGSDAPVSAGGVFAEIANAKAEMRGEIAQTASTCNNANAALQSAIDDKLPLAGGTVTGVIKFTEQTPLTPSADDSRLVIRGSSGGAYLDLHGKGYSTNPGYFSLTAAKDSADKSLVGNPSGGLTWGGRKVMAVKTGGNATTGWRLYPDGWCEQWTRVFVGDGSGLDRTAAWTFSIPFSSANYQFDGVVESWNVFTDAAGTSKSSDGNLKKSAHIVLVDAAATSCKVSMFVNGKATAWARVMVRGYTATSRFWA